MGNTRRFNPSRRQRVLGLKEQNRRLAAEAAYWQGVVQAQAAIDRTESMIRPPDLEEWIESILPDMSPEEREQWDAMLPEEQAAFIEELGDRIAASTSVLSAIPGDSPAPEAPAPSPE